MRVCERVVRVAWVEGGRRLGFWRGAREMRRWEAVVRVVRASKKRVERCILKGAWRYARLWCLVMLELGVELRGLMSRT